MASAVFKKIASATNNMRYAVRWSRAGDGLGRKKQQSAQDMTTLTPGIPRNWPVGTDVRAPILPNEAK